MERKVTDFMKCTFGCIFGGAFISKPNNVNRHPTAGDAKEKAQLCNVKGFTVGYKVFEATYIS